MTLVGYRKNLLAGAIAVSGFKPPALKTALTTALRNQRGQLQCRYGDGNPPGSVSPFLPRLRWTYPQPRKGKPGRDSSVKSVQVRTPP